MKRLQLLPKKGGLWSAFLAGIALGIISQRSPEIKSALDPYIIAIESTLNAPGEKRHSPSPKGQIGGTDFSTTHYTPDRQTPGSPHSFFLIHRTGYTLAYDARTRNPAWVYEHLTAENLKGNAERHDFAFKEDESIPKQLRSTLADYKGSGLDQGHMAPAADHHSSAQAMSDTFFLTNISPQFPYLNRDFWAKLEKHVRDLTQHYSEVDVVTGPLYLPYQEGKRRFVKYQVIGTSNVAVPTHFFKVVTVKNREGKFESNAYIVPNTFIPPHASIDDFRTTVEKVEKAAGILLFNSGH